MKRQVILLLAIVAIVVVLVTFRFISQASEGNAIAIRKVNSAKALGGSPGVEVQVSSKRPFPATSGLVVLQMGKNIFKLSEYKDSSLNTLVFTLTPAEFEAVRNESNISVRYEPDNQGRWDFGYLEKKWATTAR